MKPAREVMLLENWEVTQKQQTHRSGLTLNQYIVLLMPNASGAVSSSRNTDFKAINCTQILSLGKF